MTAAVMSNPVQRNPGLRRAVAIAGVLNLSYFVIEFIAALKIGSVSLFADSADFFEDASVNFLIFTALAWSAQRRAIVGKCLAGILLLPALAMLWALWGKFHHPVPPAAFSLGLTGAGALVINLWCSFMLARYRHTGGSLATAAFLSARNDVLANIAIIIAGFVTARFPSVWPDVVVGVGIAIMNADAAHEVWTAARAEPRLAGERA